MSSYHNDIKYHMITTTIFSAAIYNKLGNVSHAYRTVHTGLRWPPRNGDQHVMHLMFISGWSPLNELVTHWLVREPSLQNSRWYRLGNVLSYRIGYRWLTKPAPNADQHVV